MSIPDALSASQAKCFLSCARLYELRYLEKVPTIAKGWSVADRAYRHGVAFALENKMNGNPVDPQTVADVVADRWNMELRENLVYDEDGQPVFEARQVDWGEENPGGYKDRIIKLARVYVMAMLPAVSPIGVQKKLQRNVAGVPTMGVPDIQVESGVVVHKLTHKRIPQFVLNNDLHVSFYAVLIAKPIAVTFHQALDQKKPAIEPLLSSRNMIDIEWYEGLIGRVYTAIRSGIYPPNPLSHLCTDKCSYYTECKVLF